MFDWADYLRVARALRENADTQPTEAVQRSVVGRAYYAAFGHARRYPTMYLNFVPLPGRDEHTRLFDHLQRHRYRNVAGKLDMMRGSRNRCDYDDTVPNLETQMVAALENAAYIIDTLVFY